jgi:cytochrome b6-f complex iron-sulfur subunit
MSPNPPPSGCSGACGETPVGMPERRTFMKLCLGLFALSWGAMTTVPIIQYLIPPESNDAGQEVKSVSLGSIDTLPKGQGKNFQFGKKPALIVRDEAGNLHAFSAVCTHLGCTVQYDPAKVRIGCACHGGQYDPATGRNIAGPPPKPLALLQADVVKGEIVVTRAAAPQGKKEA